MVFRENLLFRMGVFIDVLAGAGERVVFRQLHILAILVVADDIGVNLVTAEGIRVVDEVGRIATCRAHIAFEGDEFALFRKARLVFGEQEELDMEETLLDAEGFHNRAACLLKGGSVEIVEGQRERIVVVIVVKVVIHDFRDRGREMVARAENDIAFRIADAIERHDDPFDILFHEGLVFLAIKMFGGRGNQQLLELDGGDEAHRFRDLPSSFDGTDPMFGFR